MANKKISELSSRTPALSDLMLVGDPSSGYSYKCTITALATIIETDIADGYVTIGTTQTVSGAKTFSNNLTLTSVPSSAIDTDKFLVLNSNVVNYRTGSQVLSDIGAADDTLVVHLAGTETITGYKTFSSFAGFDSAVSLKQNSTIVSQTGYSSIAASANGFFLTRAPGIHAFLNLADLTTTRNFTFPDVTGTLALTTDITNALTSYVPNTRTLTINGVTQSLAANRTFNVGTVETVNFTTGTTGTDVNVSGSPITTIGTITLNIPTASATNRGALSSTDWSTFNNKQSAITLTTTGSSGSATFVSNTLNVPTYTLAGLGGISGTGTTNYIPKFTSSSAIGNSQIFDNGSNVGINTASPVAMLDVNGAGVIRGFLTTTDAIKLGANTSAPTSTDAFIYRPADNTLGFGTASSEKMRITSSGLVGIGTSTPYHLLQVTSTANFGAVIKVSDVTSQSTGAVVLGDGSSSNAGVGIWRAAANSYSSTGNTLNVQGGDGIQFMTGAGVFGSATERLRISSTGNVGIGTSTPDGIIDVTSTVAGTAYSYFQNESTTGVTSVGLAFAQSGTIKSSIQSAVYGNDYMTFNVGSNTERMRLDASGNLGLGVSPSAWRSIDKVLQIGNAALWNESNSVTWLGNNTYENSGGQYIYINSAGASAYNQYNGEHRWYIAPSGTAGNAISFTQAMTLDASGRLGIGTTSPSNLLNVSGTGYVFNLSGGGTSRIAGSVNNTSGNLEWGLEGSAGNQLFTGMAAYQAGIGTSNNTSLNFATNTTVKMTITSGGNVGIGTTSPIQPLTVAALSNANTIALLGRSSDNAQRIDFYNNAGNSRLYTIGVGNGAVEHYADANIPMVFSTNATERMRITSGGLVGIGIAPTGSYSLQLYGVGSSTGSARIRLQNSTTGSADADGGGIGMEGNDFVIQNSESGVVKWEMGGSERMRITSGGELLINTTSDAGDYKLQVNGNVYAAGNLDLRAASGTTYVDLLSTGAGSKNYRVTSQLVGVSNTGFGIRNVTDARNELEIDGSGNSTFYGSIKTAAPSGGTAKPIKFGEAGVTLGGSNTSGVRVEIDGVVYYLVTGYLP